MKIAHKLFAVALCFFLSGNLIAQVPFNVYKSEKKSDLFASSLKMSKKQNSMYGLKAQEGDEDNSATGLYVGFRFMPTFTVLDYAEVDNSTIETTMVLGYGFGGLIGVAVSDHVGIQGEVIYSALAQKYKEGDRTRTIKLNYINIPLLLVLNTGLDKPINLNVAVGPQLGLNVGSSIDGSADGSGTDTVQAVLSVKKGDIGVAYGAGLDFGSGNMKFCVGFRGVFGLVDISDNSNTRETNEYYVLDKAHVKTYAGYVGITFGF